MSTRTTQLAPGATFAGHTIEAVIGRGGMGVVYRAEHLRLGRKVALKLVAPELAEDPHFRKRFERESRVAASIDHPHVVPIYEAGEEDGTLFIAMRYVEGTDLRMLVDHEGKLGASDACRTVGQVAEALDAAHSRGLVHRDIKPGNILLAGGVGGHAYLTDFGLTRHALTGGSLTRTGHFVGTFDYAAPEQIEGKRVDARTDVYALGCVLFEALSGRVPYDVDSDMAKMWAHVNKEPPSLREAAPDVARALDPVIARAMAKSPDARYPSAGDLSRDATAAVSGRSSATGERSVAEGEAAVGIAPPAPPPPPETRAAAGSPTPAFSQPPPSKSRRWRWLALAASVLLVAAAAAYGLVATETLTFADDCVSQHTGTSIPCSANGAIPADEYEEDRSTSSTGRDLEEVEDVALAYGESNGAEACRYMSDSALDQLGGQSGCREQFRGVPPANFDVQDIDLDGDSATASVENLESEQVIDLELVKEDGEWRISSFPGLSRV